MTNYVYGYLRLRPGCDGPINVALDAGDYTQAAAAYYTRLAGVPIHTVITASSAEGKAEAAGEGTAAYPSDALLPGLERVAFEFCGRDPGRVAAAAARKGGIQELVDEVCPPDFRRVPVGKTEEDAAAASTQTALCSEACRALAAASSSSASAAAATPLPLLIVAPRRPGGSVDDGTGPASTMSGSDAAPGNRNVLVSSSISIRDYIMESLAPYPPLEVPGPQAVAALNHLKRLGPQAKDRTQRRKVLELSDLLMAALAEHVPELNIKDTCLALSSVADVLKNRLAFSVDGTSDAAPAGQESALLEGLRRRLEEHLLQAPFRFSGRLLGLALNALAKVRDFGVMEEEAETRLFDLAERLILRKAEEADAFDLVSMSHIAHAYTALLRRPAPPSDVDPHLQLPDFAPDFPNLSLGADGLRSGGFAEAADGLWPAGGDILEESGAIYSANEGLELLRELEEWAVGKGEDDDAGEGAEEGAGGEDESEESGMREDGMVAQVRALRALHLYVTCSWTLVTDMTGWRRVVDRAREETPCPCRLSGRRGTGWRV